MNLATTSTWTNPSTDYYAGSGGAKDGDMYNGPVYNSIVGGEGNINTINLNYPPGTA